MSGRARIAHVTGGDGSGLLDRSGGETNGRTDWRAVLNRRLGIDQEQSEQHELRACTYAERPFGDETFVHEIAHPIGCHWKRGRPSKKSTLAPHERATPLSLIPISESAEMTSGSGLTSLFSCRLFLAEAKRAMLCRCFGTFS